MTRSEHVVWHDVECGRYSADIDLWRRLAREEAGPVLDVGAGTGRVALRLAAAGHDVTALDRDEELLASLAERAGVVGLEIETVVADAAGFDLPRRFALIAVPMQTLQLLDDRDGFFASAVRALEPGGLVAAAIADALEVFDESAPLPLPDVGVEDGREFLSQPVAVRELPGVVRIERIRQIVHPDGSRTSTDDVIELRTVSAESLAAEAGEHGLRAEAAVEIAPTDEHVGSTVVMLRG